VGARGGGKIRQRKIKVGRWVVGDQEGEYQNEFR